MTMSSLNSNDLHSHQSSSVRSSSFGRFSSWMWWCHLNMEQNLWRVLPAPCWINDAKNEGGYEGTNTMKVHLIKCICPSVIKSGQKGSAPLNVWCMLEKWKANKMRRSLQLLTLSVFPVQQQAKCLQRAHQRYYIWCRRVIFLIWLSLTRSCRIK